MRREARHLRSVGDRPLKAPGGQVGRQPAKATKPTLRPQNPLFSSGPCAKRPGWTPAVLGNALLGRSHRSPEGKARLKLALDRTRDLLRLPAGYRIAIVPGSDTGAFEMALWSLLGPRGVDVLVWESFGTGWDADVTKQLKLNVRTIAAPYGKLPDLTRVDFTHDVVFAWNGTTSGVRVPDAAWIPKDRDQDRRRHFLLAKGPGRRSRAWHARLEPARRG